MISGGNVPAKSSEMKMEEDDKIRTLECLRGRLLAERGASRLANEEADQLANKLIELEKQLKREIKSRDRAEKRLKALVKKLESISITYVVPYESEHSNSSLLEKSEFSSVSSSTASSSYPKCPQDDHKQTTPNNQFTNSITFNTDEPTNNMKSPSSEISVHNGTTTFSESHIVLPSKEDNESDKSGTEKPNDLEYTQNFNDHRSKNSNESWGKNDVEWDKSIDNSMALVPVDNPSTTTHSTTTSPHISSASVKDVLDTLRFVKERIQSSMETRHMIEV